MNVTWESTKAAVRKAMKEKRKSIPPNVLMEWSGKICANLMKTRLWREAKSIWCYVPLPGEVDTTQLFEAAWASGKKTAAPKVTPEGLVFSEIRSFNELEAGHFQVREPLEIKRIQDNFGLVILPGLAFDKKGNRIGYGKGYYDRFLAANPDHKTAGLAYDFSVFEELPSEKTDIRADMIVTESTFFNM